MFIEEVLYHIDEDYRKWCDTIDLVCEEILLEDAQQKDKWFFDMSPEKQQAYIKAHPDSEKTKELKKSLSKMKKGDSEPTSKDSPLDTASDRAFDKKYADKKIKKPDGPEPESDGKDHNIGDELPDTVADLKQHVQSVRDAIGVDVETIATAFKQPSVYNTVKAIGGSISASSRVIMGTLRTVGKSLKVGAAAIHDTPAFQQLEKGIIKVDEFMKKNKALATMSAVAVSGLAIGQWLRMSFSGDIESDFDLTIIPQAFMGEAGFRELIATPDGIKGIGLLSAGLATGGLPIWMGGATGLALALTYSGLQSAGQTEQGKKVKQKMLDWAETMGGAVERGAKAADKKLGLKSESNLFIENIVNLDTLDFAPKNELKKAKYKKIKIFDEGWDSIKLDPPPTNSSGQTKKELTQVINETNDASDEVKRQYINCDEDAMYYIKEYMDESGIEYDEEEMEYIKDQCTPVSRHYKNMFNRPRPYQLAEKYKMELNKFKTGTANTPSYPSGHSVQAYVVANYYAKKHPEHKENLRDAADICAWGRVQAGLHYPSDYKAGIKLADELIKYIKDDIKEDAPVNSTGVAVSTDTPLVRRNKYQKKNERDSKALWTRILKRYDIK